MIPKDATNSQLQTETAYDNRDTSRGERHIIGWSTLIVIATAHWQVDFGRWQLPFQVEKTTYSNILQEDIRNKDMLRSVAIK